MNNGDIRKADTVTSCLVNSLYTYDEASVLKKISEKVHKDTYIGNMYQAAVLLSKDDVAGKDDVLPITTSMLLNL